MTNPLPLLQPGDTFPPAQNAWDADSPAAGLLAVGADLSVQTLVAAYSGGIFPWFSSGQPILWWSPNPRMTLEVAKFKLHRSMRRHLQKFVITGGAEIRMDSAFEQVIQACASSPREAQTGTWIVPGMVCAYRALHEAGFAHSVETWIDGELVGGLYCVALGKAVFGESMFTLVPDASKTALAALVCFARAKGIQMIDCQQKTGHLASLGAHETDRAKFLLHVQSARQASAPTWQFDPLYWRELLGNEPPQTRHLPL